jgi:hypothetical protein
MREISLDLRGISYVTDQNVTVWAWRAFVRVRFVAENGVRVRFQAFVDPGAPFSVIPCSLWHGRRIQWTALGTHLLRAGRQSPEDLLWQGVRCDLGTTDIHLLDLDTGIRTGPHRLVAKFARQRLQPALESAAILGMSFLADTDIRLVLDGQAARVTGYLALPSP